MPASVKDALRHTPFRGIAEEIRMLKPAGFARMVKIKPVIDQRSACPYCGSSLLPSQVRWLGMRIVAECRCPSCQASLIEDLRAGHAIQYGYQVDLSAGKWFGPSEAADWLGKTLLQSLCAPESAPVPIVKECFSSRSRVIVLNCVDHLYGHALLKLLNAQRHLDGQPEYGLIVIVPRFLRWMVPDGVAEIWTADIPLRSGMGYHRAFERFVEAECERFDEIYVSEAHSHPGRFDITRFTRVPRHSFAQSAPAATFIWREDRHWSGNRALRAFRKYRITWPILLAQNLKVRSLCRCLRDNLPDAQFTIAGLGRRTSFPAWMRDARVARYDENTERESCRLYAASALVLGVHGSNMLLPSAHAGMTIDLVPAGRWDNFGQDILYQETDPRLAAFRYRYLPVGASVSEVADVATSMFSARRFFFAAMRADQA